MSQEKVPSLSRQVVAEVFGTFLLIFFGCGAVHAAVLTGAQSGLWQVAIVWGVAIMLAAYSVGGVSGAHINPAMTLALALWRGFPKSRVLPFIVAQVAGAMLAAGLLFVLFSPQLEAKEKEKLVTRGELGSIVTATCYGEYFPNPGGLASGDEPYSVEKHAKWREMASPTVAFLAEMFGTLILAFVVFALTDERNRGQPAAGHAPIFIGLTVSVLISVIAPLTQACFNPARDFGPRLFARLAGWGSVALPGQDDWSWLTVYILAPILGAAVGGGIYEFVIRPAYPLSKGKSA
ncbi:MAG: glycerol uptake facilitator protein [Planctomycetota bacterium]|nr:MAG: glycerol uptake facilitator protein [Planctomycetota bacterium]